MTPTSRRPASARMLIGLVVLAVFAVLIPSQRAAADHAPLPDTVTLVGSLQQELGCPGDWQPECAATHLEPVAGQPNLFRGTFAVPAGSFEYKVALNDSWDRELRRRRRSRRGQHPVHRSRRRHHLHLRPRHPPDHRQHAEAADRRPGRPLAASGHDRLGPAGRRERVQLPAVLGARGRPGRHRRADHRRLLGSVDAGRRTVSPHSEQKYPHLAVLRGVHGAEHAPQPAARHPDQPDRGRRLRPGGRLAAVTGVQLPGVLDDVYAGARQRTLGPVWTRADRAWRSGHRPPSRSRCC